MNDGKSARGAKEKKSGELSALSKTYMLLYNGVQTAGWGYMLIKALKFLIQNQSVLGLWEECGQSVTIFQSLAALEVIHCIVGFVPSSALITFLQVFSRVFTVWGILTPAREAQTAYPLAITLIAWGITEVVRYSYYFFNLIGSPPRPLTWCRYTFFYGLYPIGVYGEIGNIYYALDTIKRKQLFSVALPNRFNISFNFYYACFFLVASYVPIFPQLFMHMVHQRKKVLGKSTEKKAN